MDYILSLSYGKDSLACLGAIDELMWPLDRIVHTEVWATDTIHADPPQMIEFKAKADTIIKERWGIAVEHIRSNYTYNDYFYMACGEQGRVSKRSRRGSIYGWPYRVGAWCNSRLKQHPMEKAMRNTVRYIGIAADEPDRFHNLNERKRSPLVEIGWTEFICREWCEKNGLLSPIYTTATRGGCWFCHNQPVNQLRILRRDYPEYWALMLKWDADSPSTFHTDGHTIHDFDKRFQMEDDGKIDPQKRFLWRMIEE